MHVTFLLRQIKQGDLALRRLRISDGPFLSRTLGREDILRSSGVCRPGRSPWIFFHWWLRKTFFVAYCIELQLRTIGFIGLFNLVPGASAEVSLVLFDPVFRRRGYGSRAFTMLSGNTFTKAFAHTFIVRVRKDNESARSFWTKLGFETVRVDGDTIVMVMTKKRLPEGEVKETL